MENENKTVAPAPPAASNEAVNSTKGKKSIFSKIPHAKIVLPFITLVLIILISSFYFFVVEQRNKQNIVQAEIYANLQNGDFTAARAIAQKNLEKNPNSKVLTRNMIDAISGEGNQTGKEQKALQEAQPYINKALQDDANNRNTLLSIGYAYESAGQYEKALSFYQKALAIDSKYSPSYFHMGHVLSFLNRDAEAEKMYDQALALDPDNGMALVAKANFLGSRGDVQKAISMYQKAAQDEANSDDVRSGAYATLASIDISKADYKNALINAKKAVDLDKNSAFALGKYGFSLAQTGDTTDGVAYLKKAISQNPRMTTNYILLAVILRGEKDYTQALNILQTALQGVDNDNTVIGTRAREARRTKILYELAETYSMENDVSNAVKYLQMAIQRDVTLKRSAKENRNNYFTTIKNSPEFVSLVQ